MNIESRRPRFVGGLVLLACFVLTGSAALAEEPKVYGVCGGEKAINSRRDGARCTIKCGPGKARIEVLGVNASASINCFVPQLELATYCDGMMGCDTYSTLKIPLDSRCVCYGEGDLVNEFRCGCGEDLPFQERRKESGPGSLPDTSDLPSVHPGDVLP